MIKKILSLSIQTLKNVLIFTAAGLCILSSCERSKSPQQVQKESNDDFPKTDVDKTEEKEREVREPEIGEFSTPFDAQNEPSELKRKNIPLASRIQACIEDVLRKEDSFLLAGWNIQRTCGASFSQFNEGIHINASESLRLLNPDG